MKQYTKQIDGKTVIKTRNEIVLRVKRTITDKDGNIKEVTAQVINPKEEQLLADGWVEYVAPVAPELTEEQKVKAAVVRARHKKRNEILEYDKSSEVNSFYVGEMSIWLDKATRAGLLLRFQAEAAQGLVSTSLWYNGTQFPLQVEQAIQMLYAIELYASACYDNTQRHYAAINALTTVDELEQYDYRSGYPDKLRF